MTDNTVGSRPTKTDLAYIAGFFDGDGSVMLQVKKRSDSQRGWRFMATMCFYQDTRHEEPLLWIRRTLGIGYLSRRNDGMTEVRINGFDRIRKILVLLIPYLRFKRTQATAVSRACTMLAGKSMKQLTEREKRMVCRWIMVVQQHNYRTHQKRSEEDLWSLVGLTP